MKHGNLNEAVAKNKETLCSKQRTNLLIFEK